MTSFLFMLLFSVAHAAPGEISGVVNAGAGVTLKPGGVLFVIAKEAGKPMPVAVLRIPDPKLPYAFSLSAKNAMVAGTPFTGPFLISARFSPTGDAMDRSGAEGAITVPVAVGKSDLKIELKAK